MYGPQVTYGPGPYGPGPYGAGPYPPGGPGFYPNGALQQEIAYERGVGAGVATGIAACCCLELLCCCCL